MIDALQALYDAGWTTAQIARAVHAPRDTVHVWSRGQHPAQDRHQQLTAILTGAPTYYVVEPVAKFWRVVGLHPTPQAAQTASERKRNEYSSRRNEIVRADGAPWFLDQCLETATIERLGEWVGEREVA